MSNFDTVKHLDLSNERVVVSGGTQGIGAAIALLCARKGARVAVIGRNVEVGQDMLAKLAEASMDKTVKHAFFSADLSTVANNKEVAKKVEEWAGDQKVGYLFMSQGTLAVTDVTLTEDNFVKPLAVQILSRFVLSYTLIEAGVMKPSGTIVSLAVAGKVGNTIDFEHFNGQGLKMLSTRGQMCAVIDCFTKEMSIRYQPLRAIHLFPGVVRTNISLQPDVPWFIRYPIMFSSWIPCSSRTPDEYAPIALWTAASEEARGQVGICSWDENGKPVSLSPPALDEVERGKVWDKLVSYTK